MSNVISEKQQKTILRGKKAKKETVKNVLASPYTHYWPLINNEDSSSLKEILKSNLPKIKEQTKNIPWEEIKYIPREERREYRKKQLNSSIKSYISNPKYMYFGINEVTKLLEQNEAISVLLTHDVIPQLMIKHVVDLCVFKKIPILVMSNLKHFLKETVGISATTIGFKRTLQNYLITDKIRKVISDIFIKYPVSEKHACFSKTEKNFFNPPKIETLTESKIEDEESIENVYLYRDSSKSRIFIPRSYENNETVKHIDKTETGPSGFLNFTNDCDKAQSNYKSLVVKCTRNNPNRNKEKFDMIKNNKRKRKD